MKILKTIAIAALALSLTACSTTETKFSKTVEDVIERADRMSDKDWERSDRVIERMMDGYLANPDKLSGEEWISVNAAYAKYNAAKAKHELKKATQEVSDFFEEKAKEK